LARGFTLIAGVGCLMIFIALTLGDTQYRGRVLPIEAKPIVEQVPAEKFVGKPAHGEGTEKTTNH